MSALIPKADGPKASTGGYHADQGSRRTRQHGSGLKYVTTFAVTAAADGLQIAFPPLWIPVSLITALILFALWGWRWEILCVMVPEFAPGIDIFPSWVAIAIYLTGRDARSVPYTKDGLRRQLMSDNLPQTESKENRTNTDHKS